MTSTTRSFLRRYTDLPALLHLLRGRKITLLDPKSWDDSNDSYYLAKFKEKKELKTVLALCFSQAAETYHHWRVFSPGPAGVCIVFNRDGLLASMPKKSGILHKDVEYLTLPEARARTLVTKELPFIKRAAFIDEDEYRVVFWSASEALPSLSIPISLDCIRSISLSPWLHKNLLAATKEAIWSIVGCQDLKLSKSTLISNEDWKALSERAV
jgi:hypothetical protein